MSGALAERYSDRQLPGYILSGELCEQILGRHARGATRPTSARPKKEGRGSFASKVPFLRDEEAVQRQRENEARAKHQLRRDAQQPPPRMQRSAAWDPDEAELAFRGANPKARLYADGLRTVAQPADLCFVIWKKATALGEDDMVLGSRHTLRAYRARSRVSAPLGRRLRKRQLTGMRGSWSVTSGFSPSITRFRGFTTVATSGRSGSGRSRAWGRICNALEAMAGLRLSAS